MTKKDKLNRLAKAANHLRTAADALKEIIDDGNRENGYYLTPDCQHYRHQILELLSSDDGEAGLQALIAVVAKEV